VWSREPYRGETITVNEEGDRVHPPTTEEPIGTLRLFGGSTLWGMGVADENTIPAQLNRLFPRYHVANHGEAGFISRQEIARLVNLAAAERPMDLVIFYDGVNDVGTLCRPDVPLNGNQRTEQIRRRVKPSSFLMNAFAGSLLEVLHGEFFKLHVYKTYEQKSPCLDPEYADRVALTLIQNWKIARSVAETGGAAFMAVLQPVAPVGSPRLDHLSPSEYEKEVYRIVYARIRERIAQEGVPWMLDLTHAFDGDEYIYIDTNHVTANGNRRMAESIAPHAAAILAGGTQAGGGPSGGSTP
jgi:lysophospholipase L1-like esterase